ncbi:MAG: Holliday junction resolvase RuvX, partial [Nitrospirae bacterium]|nr:Holliday junction resolvase RuvX [Nitrospirota bacterium]
DHGTKRIGVALSDELGWTAQPLETFERRTLERDIAHIQDLVRTHDIGQVLLGLPLRLNGEEGPAVQAVHEFVARLGEALTVPIVTWDERMTTKAAEDLLIAADVSRKKRKGVVDRVAAAILLQSYLEAQAPPAPMPSASGSAEGDTIEERENRTENGLSYETAPDPDRVSLRRRARWTGGVSDDSVG